ncbi:MAG: hypothetical protein AAF196_03415 [Planctomycetota bacterium]
MPGRTRIVGALLVVAVGWLGLELMLRDVPVRPGRDGPAEIERNSLQVEGAVPGRSAAPPAERRPTIGPRKTKRRSAGRSDDAVFDAFVETFVRLAGAAAAQHERGESVEAKSGEIDDLVRDLENRIADAAERSVSRWVASPADEKSRFANRLFARVLQRALTERLRRPAPLRHTAGESPLDHLVRRILARVPESETTARFFGESLLANQPFLGEGSEADLLSLTELAPDREFLTPVLAKLLQTLWENLRRSGARTPVQLDALARLFADDWNPARQLAAASELFAHGDAGLRALLIEKAKRSRDPRLAAAVGRSAVDHLQPRAAFDTIVELSPILDRPPIALLDALALRDVSVLVEGYEERLATGHSTGLRAALTSAMFANRGEAANEFARTALQLDPDPQVRERALLLAAARLPSDEAFEWLHSALLDERLGEPARRLEVVALALHNLAPRAAAGRTIEWIEQLSSDPACTESVRRQLRSARGRIPRESER